MTGVFRRTERRRRRRLVPLGASGTQDLQPGLLASSATFYSPTVTTSYTLQPGLLASAATFYAPTVTATYDLQPGLLASAATFYAPTVTPGAVDLQPGLLASAATFYSPTVTATYDLAPSLLASAAIFYAPTVTTGNQLAPPLLASAATFYAASIQNDLQFLVPGLLASAATFYAPTVTPGAVDLQPGLLASSASFYLPTVTTSYSLAPGLLASAASFFSPTVTTGPVTVAPPLLASAATFYAATITQVQELLPPLLASAATFYSASIQNDLQFLQPPLLASNAVFYQHRIAVEGEAETTYAALEPVEQYAKKPDPVARKRRLQPPFNIRNWDVPPKQHHLGQQLSQLASYVVEEVPSEILSIIESDGNDPQIIVKTTMKTPLNNWNPGFAPDGRDVFIWAGGATQDININGMRTGKAGQVVFIHNPSDTWSIWLNHDQSGAQKGKKIHLQGDYRQEIPPGGTFGLVYLQRKWVPVQVSERGLHVQISLTAAQYNNWDPGLVPRRQPWIVELSATQDTSITGIAAGVEGQAIYLVNSDTSDQITLVYGSPSSSIENRLLLPLLRDVDLNSYESGALVYASSRWRLISRALETTEFIWDASSTLRRSYMVYHSWAAVHAAATAFNGPCWIVLHSDDDPDETFTIPNGSWSMNGGNIKIRSRGRNFTLAFAAGGTRLRNLEHIEAGEILGIDFGGQDPVEHRGQRLTLSDLETSSSPTYQACIDNTSDDGQGIFFRNVIFGAHSGSSKHYAKVSFLASTTDIKPQVVFHDCRLDNNRVLRSDGDVRVGVRGANTTFSANTSLFLPDTAGDDLQLAIEDGVLNGFGASWDSSWTGASGTTTVILEHDAEYTFINAAAGDWPSGTDPTDTEDAVLQNNALAVRTVHPDVISAALTASTFNWDPTNWDTCNVCVITPDTNTWSIGGFEAPTSGGTLIRHCVNGSNTDSFTLLHQNGTATAARRINCPNASTHTVNPLGSFILFYRESTSRWYLLGAA